MANENIYTVGKLQDRQVLSLFDAVREKFPKCDETYYYGSASVNAEDFRKTIGKEKSYILRYAVLNEQNGRFTLEFRRNVTSSHQLRDEVDLNRRAPSPYFDEIILKTSNAQNSPPSTILEVDGIISSLTFAKPPKSGATNNVYDLLQKEIADLAAFHKTMLENNEEQRRKQEESYRRKEEEFETSMREQREVLSEEAKREASKIAKLRAELEETKKALDDRNHMHVRRDLREKISEEIKGRVSGHIIPANISILSSLVAFLSVAAAFFAGYIAYGSYEAFVALLQVPTAKKAIDIEPNFWLLVSLAVRGGVASIVAIGFVIYTLGWMRKIYLDNVRVTHDLQRYALDINRASWVIETVMEINSREGDKLPDQWIEGACFGLFRDSEETKSEISSLEAWRALLGVSGKLSHGPDGTVIEVDRRGVKKILKESEG